MFEFNNQFSKIADVTNKFIVCVGMDGNYLYTNLAYNNRFGFQGGSLVGRPSMNDIHVDDHHLAIETVGKCMNQLNTAFDVVLRKPSKSGGFVYTQWDFFAISNEHNQPEYVMCVGMEISTLIEQVEAQVSKLNEVVFDQSHLVRRPLANILSLSQILMDKANASEEERKIMIAKMQIVARELDDVLRYVVSKASK